VIESKQKRKVTVGYRRAVSDGNYGTESAEVSLEWFVDEDDAAELDQECAAEMLRNARDLVLQQLRGSLSENVRRSLKPRTTAPPAMAPTSTAATVPADDEDPF